MLTLTLRTTSWNYGFSLEPDCSNGDPAAAPLVSARWLSGTATANLLERQINGEKQVVASSNSVRWTIMPDRQVDKNGNELRIEAGSSRTSGLVGIGEIAPTSGYIHIASLGSSSFEWLVRAFEARGSAPVEMEFMAERAPRGNLHLLGIRIGQGGPL